MVSFLATDSLTLVPGPKALSSQEGDCLLVLAIMTPDACMVTGHRPSSAAKAQSAAIWLAGRLAP